jgi:hypothetical protein
MMHTQSDTYFSGFRDYFWQWEDAGEVIAIPHGPTIIYREHLLTIMESLNPEGTPVFGALLLAIVATNPESESALAIAQKTFERDLEKHPSTMISEAFQFLRSLSKIPAQYKTDSLRIILFQTLFHHCHYKISPHKTKRLSRFLDPATRSQYPITQHEQKSWRSEKDLRTLSLLLTKFPSTQHILNEMAGIPNLHVPKDPILPLDPGLQKPVPEKSLVDQLISKQQTFHIGSLIKYLWGGLNITLHNVVPSAQPLGGISDLTNKGSFDKILLSEFANDDLVFMSRLANNEALYIQREIPPEHNENERILLIDTSLKMWGTPKILSYAIMLAIAKHPKTDINCKAYAVGKTHQALAFESVDEIIQSIQHVSGALSAVAGIESYFEEFPDHKNREIILITEESCVHSPDMVRILSEHQTTISYIIFVDAQGRITLQKRQKSGNRILQKISLPLDQFWKSQPDVIQHTDINFSNEIPILLSNPSQPQATFYNHTGNWYQITVNGHILKGHHSNLSPENNITKNPYSGQMIFTWELIFPNIKIIGTKFELGKNQSDDPILLNVNKIEPIFTLTNLNTGKQISSHLQNINPYRSSELIFKDGHFYISMPGYSYWQISVDGDIKSTARMDEKLFYTRRESKESMNKAQTGRKSIIKKTNLVAITAQSELLIGAFRLSFKEGNFQFTNTNKPTLITKAQREENSVFRFADGSSIQCFPFGAIMLISSNKDIPAIYIPTPTDTLLGMQADSIFAGNPSFHNNNRQSDTLIEMGTFNEKYVRPFIERIVSFTS